MSQAVSGRTCQYWNHHHHHGHGYRHNYCRNPDGSMDGVWCYTSPGIKELCRVRVCCGCDTGNGQLKKGLLEV